MLDPAIVHRLLNRAGEPGPLEELSHREREILALMAEGPLQPAHRRVVLLSHKTVESHVPGIFMKLGLNDTPDASRRVLAVLAFLRG